MFQASATEDDSSSAPVRVVVLGGGTAGWMVAAALAVHVEALADVTLVESEDIGIVGVGEATLPHIRDFVTKLGIDEASFMAATDATYKLGIAFHDFGAIGERYIHPFGTFGRPLGDVGFHHFWLRASADGTRAPFADYSLGVVAAEMRRFRAADPGDLSLAGSYGYAYQFDATRFGPFLRAFAIDRGVRRIEGIVRDIARDPESGDVTALQLADGTAITGDLFVDCSGFRSLLLGGTLESAWEDWSAWLPCDRAAALPTDRVESPIAPYTDAIAMRAGWRWRIPLTSRTGNGYVFASRYCSEDEACAALLAAVDGTPLADPRVLHFRAGRRRESWIRNVVAIGLASGFLEPLESTSIYLVQMAIARLIELFPVGGATAADRAAFNARVDMEYDRIRDFLILHYHATVRTDTPFWNHVRDMRIPETLAEKLALWRETGRVARYDDGLFLEPSWIAVLIGQGILPAGWDARAALPPPDRLNRAMAELHDEVRRLAAAMPVHAP